MTPRFICLFWLLMAGLLLSRPAQAQARWQLGPDAAFLVQHFRSVDPTGLLKPHFRVVSGTGGLRLSYRINDRTGYVETGLYYAPLSSTIAPVDQPGHASSGGSGLWVIPLLLRRNVDIRLPGMYRRNGLIQLALAAGMQNQFLLNRSGMERGSFIQGGGNYLLTAKAKVSHLYNPALYTEAAIRFRLLRNRLDGLLQLNAAWGLGEVFRTNVTYTIPPGTPATRQTYVQYKGSGTGWGVGLRYQIR